MAGTVTSGNAGIVSALDSVYTFVDNSGNPHVEAWMILEAQGIYTTGGLAYDLSPHFRRITEIMTTPVSGGQLKAPISGTPNFLSGTWVNAVPVREDFTTPTSARFILIAGGILSGADNSVGLKELVTGNISGVRHLAHVIGY